MATRNLAWRCPYCKHTAETNRNICKHIDTTHMDSLASKYLQKRLTKAMKQSVKDEKPKNVARKS